MKTIAQLALAALVGSAASFGTYKYLDNSRPQDATQATLSQPPIHRVNYALHAPEASLNFAEAARASINGVVHVKTKTMRKNPHQYMHPFHRSSSIRASHRCSLRWAAGPGSSSRQTATSLPTTT
jgi:hypothetical protein